MTLLILLMVTVMTPKSLSRSCWEWSAQNVLFDGVMEGRPRRFLLLKLPIISFARSFRNFLTFDIDKSVWFYIRRTSLLLLCQIKTITLFMGGVDYNDQLRGYYNVRCKFYKVYVVLSTIKEEIG